MVGGDQPVHLVDGGGMRKQRGGVPIIAHAQSDEVETGAFGTLQPEAIAQFRFVAGRGHVRLQFTLHAVNLAWMERHVIEQGLAGHVVVAVGVVGGHGALIDPVKIELVPGHARAPGLVGVGQ